MEDGKVAESGQQREELWFIRENITTALSHNGAVYKYDMSLRVGEMYELVEETRERLKDVKEAQVLGYGHMGDGNLHLNISVPERSERVTKLVEPFVYEWTGKKAGSVSAEHGIGQMKKKYLNLSKSKSMIGTMQGLKRHFDPKGILNPGKVVPDID